MRQRIFFLLCLGIFLYALSVSAWINCTPSACPSGFTDNGIYCIDNYCFRNCTGAFCSDSWAQVHSDLIEIVEWGPGADEEYDWSTYYSAPSQSNCYKYFFDAAANSVSDIDMEVDETQDCDSHAFAGLRDGTNPTHPWFENITTGYLGDAEGDQFDYLFEMMYAHADDDADSNYRIEGSQDFSVYCAPNPSACENISDTCGTGCYSHSTQIYLFQGYEETVSGLDYQDELFHNTRCGSETVDQNLYNDGYYRVYSASTYAVDDTQLCEMINEAPSVSDVSISPESPTLGDDLTCTYNYVDPEDYLEKNSSYLWFKNGVAQQYNSKILLKDNLSLNDHWSCKVSPSDGLLFGNYVGSGNITILSSVSDLVITVGDIDIWNRSGYFSGADTFYDFTQVLNDEIEDCVPDPDGYCNITISVSSNTEGSITLSNLEIYHRAKEIISIDSLEVVASDGDSRVFRGVISNRQSSMLSGVNFTMDYQESSLNSNTSIDLEGNESIWVYSAHGFTTSGSYTVVATSRYEDIEDSASIEVEI